MPGDPCGSRPLEALRETGDSPDCPRTCTPIGRCPPTPTGPRHRRSRPRPAGRGLEPPAGRSTRSASPLPPSTTRHPWTPGSSARARPAPSLRRRCAFPATAHLSRSPPSPPTQPRSGRSQPAASGESTAEGPSAWTHAGAQGTCFEPDDSSRPQPLLCRADSSSTSNMRSPPVLQWLWPRRLDLLRMSLVWWLSQVGPWATRPVAPLEVGDGVGVVADQVERGSARGEQGLLQRAQPEPERLTVGEVHREPVDVDRQLDAKGRAAISSAISAIRSSGSTTGTIWFLHAVARGEDRAEARRDDHLDAGISRSAHAAASRELPQPKLAPVSSMVADAYSLRSSTNTSPGRSRHAAKRCRRSRRRARAECRGSG